MGAKILRELLEVQYSILVGVPGLHHLKTQTARPEKNKCFGIWQIFGQGPKELARR